MNIRLSLLIALSTIACVGGGGGLSQSLETQDRAPLSNERASSTTEGSRRSLEPAGNTLEATRNSAEPAPGNAGGGGGGGGFDCAGTYRCSVNGETDDDPVVLNGACTTADGTALEQAGIVVNGNGFTYSTSVTSKGQTISITLVCTKVSSDTTPAKKDDKSTTSSSSSSGSSGASSGTRDAG